MSVGYANGLLGDRVYPQARRVHAAPTIIRRQAFRMNAKCNARMTHGTLGVIGCNLVHQVPLGTTALNAIDIDRFAGLALGRSPEA